MNDTLGRQHAILLLKYSGISFVSGAVNHGFFSGERSLWTAAAGIVLFVAGAWWEHRRDAAFPRQDLPRTLAWGALLSIGLGFFTGGLQHFPDSPARSAWVVPLGFFLSAIALAAQAGRRPARAAALGTLALGAAVVAGSLAAWQWLPPSALLAHDHGAPATAPAVDRTVVIRMSDEMRFEPALVKVRRGETVRFVALNEGRLQHELVLGTEADLRAHAAAMQAGQGHAHASGAATSVAPGAAGEFVASFARDEVLDMACLVPGHFEAGMRGKVEVAAAEAAAAPQAGHGHAGHEHR